MDILLAYKWLIMLLLSLNSYFYTKMTSLDKSKYRTILRNIIVLAFSYLCIISLIYNHVLNTSIGSKHILLVFIITLILPIFICVLSYIDKISKFAHRLSHIITNHFKIIFFPISILSIIGLCLNLDFVKKYFLTISISAFIIDYVIVVINENDRKFCLI